MKTIAVITEFNPFHNGHEYFLKKARELSGADFVVAVMSGNYVQRGEPALIDKYQRALMALKGGCDLVLELPVQYAIGSAGNFARYSVNLINSLGVVDELWFGSESGNENEINELAKILSNETDSFKEALSSFLKSGSSYPKARMEAIESLYGDKYSDLLSSSNNNLALEYTIALMQLNSTILVHTIKRCDSGYDNDSMTGEFSSATAIRKCLNCGNNSSIFSSVPAYTKGALDTGYFIKCDDYSSVLRYALLSETADSLCAYNEISKDLALRIKNNENNFSTFTDLIEKCKAKNYTYSHISRCLFNIILKIKKYQDPLALEISSARILGMKNCGELLHLISANSSVKLSSAPLAKEEDFFTPDLFSSNLYFGIQSAKYGIEYKNDFQRKLIKI